MLKFSTFLCTTTSILDKKEVATEIWRRSGQSVTASDFGSNGPRFESGRGRCVESLDKALYSHCPKAFTLASISYLAILVKYILAKKKKIMHTFCLM